MTQRAVREILIDAIQQVGADGLRNHDYDCYCLASDLAPYRIGREIWMGVGGCGSRDWRYR